MDNYFENEESSKKRMHSKGSKKGCCGSSSSEETNSTNATKMVGSVHPKSRPFPKQRRKSLKTTRSKSSQSKKSLMSPKKHKKGLTSLSGRASSSLGISNPVSFDHFSEQFHSAMQSRSGNASVSQSRWSKFSKPTKKGLSGNSKLSISAQGHHRSLDMGGESKETKGGKKKVYLEPVVVEEESLHPPYRYPGGTGEPPHYPRRRPPTSPPYYPPTYPPTGQCKQYLGLADCTKDASVKGVSIRTPSEYDEYRGIPLCVGDSYPFRPSLNVLDGNYQMSVICTDPYALLSMKNVSQRPSIKEVLWECKGANPPVYKGFLYKPTFPNAGYHKVNATVSLNPPENCYDGKLKYKAPPKVVVVNGVDEIRSLNGFDDGELLEAGKKKTVKLEAVLALKAPTDTKEVEWELSPPEAGKLVTKKGSLFANYVQSKDYVGELSITAKLCPKDPGASFDLKIVGDFWITADKDLLCQGSGEVVNLQAFVQDPTARGNEIYWTLQPAEAGRLAQPRGFTNRFIPNGEYVSKKYKDIRISGFWIKEEKEDSVDETIISFKLFSKGVRKDEPAGINGVNPPLEINPKTGDNSKQNGRIFVDTQERWDGLCIKPKHFDKQRVKFRVELEPKDFKSFVRKKIKIKWQVFDLDDPADHIKDKSEHVIDFYPRYDPSQPPSLSKQLKKGNKADTMGIGGDNTGIEHEGSSYWLEPEFQKAGIYLQRQTNYNITKPSKSAELVGETVSELYSHKNYGGKSLLKSDIYFYFSDHGGDNFIIKAIPLVEKKERLGCSKETGTLTVWRKRCAQVMAQKGFYPSPSGDENPYEIQKILQAGYGNIEVPESCAYIDFYVKNATKTLGTENTIRKINPLNLPPTKLKNERFSEVPFIFDYVDKYIYYLTDDSNYGEYSAYFTIVGFDSIGYSSRKDDPYYGLRLKNTPFVLIATGECRSSGKSLIKKAEGRTAKWRIKKTLIHEVGHLLHHGYLKNPKNEFVDKVSLFHHSLAPESLVFKTSEELKRKWIGENCYFRSTSTEDLIKTMASDKICKRHVRMLRNSIRRYFWYQYPIRVRRDIRAILRYNNPKKPGIQKRQKILTTPKVKGGKGLMLFKDLYD